MDEYTNVELGVRILPGVDLTLWLWIVVTLVLAAGAVGIALIAA